ncbi:hypothetical protein DFQ26_004807 [Actinomortierella ambigua]|nr:hypothetical protein DFQ26_004807 [Actinomortierella ambigua]
MKSTVLVAVILAVAISAAHGFTCPDALKITNSCLKLNVLPLVCSDPNVNVPQCNDKQCSQPYIDDYAICQCRGSSTDFFRNANNVEAVIKRCRLTKTTSLSNPYGDPNRYRAGSGTQTFPAATSTVTSQPIVGPTPTRKAAVSYPGYSGGSIAGAVLGLLALSALAFLLALCWRRKREDPIYNQHLLADPRGPTRTVVTEKIEPVVVKAVPSNQVYSGTPSNQVYTSTPAGVGSAGGSTGHLAVDSAGNVGHVAHTGSAGDPVVVTHPNTSYNANTASGY